MVESEQEGKRAEEQTQRRRTRDIVMERRGTGGERTEIAARKGKQENKKGEENKRW